MIKLEVRNVSNLPYVADFWGEPEYGIQLIRPDGVTSTFDISTDGEIFTNSYDVGDTRTIGLRIVEVDLQNYDEITRERLTSMKQLLSGRQFRLDVSLPGYQESQNLVHLFAKANFFDPENSSGSDRNYEGARSVSLSEVYKDSLDFEMGDSTDHLLLNANAGQCNVLLLSAYDDDINILYSTKDNKTEIKTIFFTNKFFESDDKMEVPAEKISLNMVNCSGYPMHLQTQAYKPRAKANSKIKTDLNKIDYSQVLRSEQDTKDSDIRMV